MNPRVLDPAPDQAEDVIVVSLGDGWELVVTEGAAVLTHDAGGCVEAVRVEPGRA